MQFRICLCLPDGIKTKQDPDTAFFDQVKMSEFLPLVELSERIKLNRWKRINCFFVVNVKCQRSKTVSLPYILTISKNVRKKHKKKHLASDCKFKKLNSIRILYINYPILL